MTQPTLLLTVLGVLLALAVVVAVLVHRYGDAWSRRIQDLFRRPEKPAKAPGPNHYYKPYWS